MKRLAFLMILMVAVACALIAAPVLAAPGPGAPDVQDSGGVHFGAYTLEAGNSVSGDLVVFGGPVALRSNSQFNGDLTVFGQVSMEEGSTLAGQLVVFGSADVAGTIDGDVFAMDSIAFQSTAHVGGNVSAVGNVDQAPGAVIEGQVKPIDQSGWQWPSGITFPHLPSNPVTGAGQIGGRWLNFLWNVVRGVAGVVIMGLLAAVIASLWPVQSERAGRVIEEAPLVSFGVGLLGLILSGLAAALLAITICLSPFAVIGLIIVGVGLLLGWVSLGLVLGRRILVGLLNQTAPSTAVAAVVGTTLLTLLLAISRIFGVLNGLLVFLLVPLGAGAVVLTRFGSMPYATRGNVPTGTVVSASTARPLAPSAPQSPAPPAAPPASTPPENEESSPPSEADEV